MSDDDFRKLKFNLQIMKRAIDNKISIEELGNNIIKETQVLIDNLFSEVRGGKQYVRTELYL